ncbi:hypothetical protein BCR42DRAFT_426150 [Absidia repens]|uniref:Uncharacterized protein n=1 Tax=Absidia repens TaxID=90262 RepID=A0A1X2I1H6_9FUNG|nr:hypothetical protein BCR42DRAFT_426150 [Absidia repens]
MSLMLRSFTIRIKRRKLPGFFLSLFLPLFYTLMTSTPMNFAQASCLVFGYPPNRSNQRRAMARLQQFDMVPVYISGGSSVIPVAVAIDVQERNPFLYKKYPENSQTEDPQTTTSPSSPTPATNTFDVEEL